MHSISLASLSVWDFAARHPGILLVLLGVAGEGLEIFIELKDLRKKIERPSAFKLRLKFWGAICWIVLIAGLWMEMTDSGKIDSQLKDAETKAGNAIKQASSDERQVARLKNDTAQLVSTNLALMAKIEELRSKNDALEEEQGPMTIGDEISFADAISPPVEATIIVTNSSLDEKSLATANELVAPLKYAGWKHSFNLYRPPGGISIKFNVNPTNDNDPASVAARLFHKALADRNIPVQFDFATNCPDIPPETVILQVGQRPAPILYDQIVTDAKIYDVSRETEIAIKDPKTKRAELMKLWKNYINLLMRAIHIAAVENKHTIPTKGKVWVADDSMAICFSDGQPVFAGSPKENIGIIITNGAPAALFISGAVRPMPDFDK